MRRHRLIVSSRRSFRRGCGGIPTPVRHSKGHMAADNAAPGPLADVVAGLMPQLRADLADLVAIPSVSVANFPEETHTEILRAHDAVAALFAGAGVAVDVLELP